MSTNSVNAAFLIYLFLFVCSMMPRSSVGFSNRFINSKHSIQYADDDELTNEGSDDNSKELIKIEKRLRSKTKLHRQRSSSRSNIDIVVEDEASKVVAVESIKNDKENSDSEFEDSIQEYLHHDDTKRNGKSPAEKDATFNSWHDLDFPKEKFHLPRSHITDGPTPWSNFHDLVLGQRFLNARLSTVPRNLHPNSKQVTWSDSQAKIVTDLINEANALLDIFDQVAM